MHFGRPPARPLHIFPRGLRTDESLLDERGHRAIGVVYRPEYEQYGNYSTVLLRRYDAFLNVDQTQKLHPLDVPVAVGEEVPETYPSGV